MHLSRPVRAMPAQPWWCFELLARFGVDQPAWGKPRLARGQKPIPRIVGEWWIEKDDPEVPCLASQVGASIGAMNFEPFDMKVGGSPLQCVGQHAAAVHCDHKRGATRKRLDRERAGTRIKIEAREAGEILTEPVEKRLPHPVGRRP